MFIIQCTLPNISANFQILTHKPQLLQIAQDYFVRYQQRSRIAFSSLMICKITFARVLFVRLFRFVFAIVADDSSVVYYKMSAGLVPPAPPEMLEKKKQCRQRQFQLRSKRFVTTDEAAELTANFVSSNGPSSQDNT